jgi:uncharacterized protein YodC (DUF2158 family)
MTDEIKVGDVVQPKAGSIKMVVESIDDHLGTESALCAYEIGGKRKTEHWPLASLKHSEAAS